MFGLTWSEVVDLLLFNTKRGIKNYLTQEYKSPGNLYFGLLICIYFVYAIEATFRVAINNSTAAAIIIDFGSRLVVP